MVRKQDRKMKYNRKINYFRKCKRVTRIILFVFLSSFLTTYQPDNLSFGAFLDTGWGARPTALGGAFCSLADDANAPFWNPAGLARLKRPEITCMYSRPYMGLELYAGEDTTSLGMGFFSFALPVKELGVFGISATDFYTASLYQEMSYLLSWATDIEHFLSVVKGELIEYKWENEPRFYAGLNIKFFSHKYTLDDYSRDDAVFQGGTSKMSFTFDVGFLADLPAQNLLLGFSCENLTQPDVGLKDKDPVPMDLRFGASYSGFKRVVPSCDVSYLMNDSAKQSEMNVHLGSEVWLFQDRFCIRAGGNINEASLGLGAGSSIGGLLFQIDYAFCYPLKIEGSYGTHRISLTMRWGKEQVEYEEEE